MSEDRMWDIMVQKATDYWVRRTNEEDAAWKEKKRLKQAEIKGDKSNER